MHASERLGQLANELVEAGLQRQSPGEKDIVEVGPRMTHLHAHHRRFQTAPDTVAFDGTTDGARHRETEPGLGAGAGWPLPPLQYENPRRAAAAFADRLEIAATFQRLQAPRPDVRLRPGGGHMAPVGNTQV
jgi:hypothetical protein